MGHLFSCALLADSNRQMPGRGAEEFKTLKKAYGKGTSCGARPWASWASAARRSLASYALGCGMNVTHDPFVDHGNELTVGGQTLTVECPLHSLEECWQKPTWSASTCLPRSTAAP